MVNSGCILKYSYIPQGPDAYTVLVPRDMVRKIAFGAQKCEPDSLQTEGFVLYFCIIGSIFKGEGSMICVLCCINNCNIKNHNFIENHLYLHYLMPITFSQIAFRLEYIDFIWSFIPFLFYC